jgi:hypothetical protein
VSLALPSALGAYRLPDVIGDKLFNFDEPSGTEFHRFSYDGLELYWQRPEYLVSAGGIYTRIQKLMFWPMPNDGYVMPSFLIPAKGLETDGHQLIRIEGPANFRKRVATCVAPDFACGLNPVVPDSLPAECVRQMGDWTFVNFTAPTCPLDYGIYAAVFSAPCDSHECREKASSYGFFEAVPAGSLEFREYVSQVLMRNQGHRYSSRGRNRFKTTSGHDLEFEFMPGCSRTWAIVSIDGVKQERNTRRWPLVQGEFLNADGRGLVTIENRALGRRLVLDARDALRPSRREEPL